MPQSLRHNVAKHIYKDVISNTPFFEQLPDAFVSAACKHLQPITVICFAY